MVRDGLSRESFLKLLRADLNHLYDADHLRQSPLLDLFGLSSRFDAPFALQGMLIAAIEGLRPAKSDPAASHYWRIYQILNIRYIQQAGQEEVATQFGMSVRHARREQQAALEFLGAKLWNEFHLTQEKPLAEITAGSGGRNKPEDASREDALRGDALREDASREDALREDAVQMISENELTWLKAEGLAAPVDFSLLLPQILDLVEPLARQIGVSISLREEIVLPLLAVRWVVLRQAMINLITLAIQVASDRLVEIDAQMQGDFLHVQVSSQIGDSFDRRFEEQQASLDLIRRMIEIFHGQMWVEISPPLFHAHLLLPAVKAIKVLVVDDNPDFLQLMQRFTENTRYQLTGIQDPAAALSTARQEQPDIIVLDVMMPDIDGWQVLRELKQDDLANKARIVVCTVFAQKDLGFSLGADDFAQKPISQESLLAALDRQAVQLGKIAPQESAGPQADH